MNKLTTAERAQILACLCEGNSIRATARLTGAAINTVVSLLVNTGKACAKLHNERVRGVKAQRVQCDEIWSFCYYNFCRIHQTLRVTPAMEASISDHVWSLEELVNLTASL